MAHKTLVNGTAYDISTGDTLVNGTSYKITGGRTLSNGTGYSINLTSTAPLTNLVVSTCENITNDSIVELSKYSADVDVSNYINAPFLIIAVSKTGAGDAIGYFDGTAFTYLINSGGVHFPYETNALDMTTNILAISNMDMRDIAQIYIIT